MYAREIGEETLTFGVSGKLIMNALVMYDHQTRSLWSQFLGQSVKGEYAGARLDLFPALLTDWSTWVELHPDTVALDLSGDPVRDELGSYDPYTDYYASGSPGVIGETVRDTRLPIKEFVIGLEADGEAVAYPYRALNETPVVNDTFQDVPVAVVLDADSGAGVVFRRTVDGRTLTFDPAPRMSLGEDVDGPLFLVDRETESRWTALTGMAVEGPLEGAALEPFPSLLSYWFAWKDYYPHTQVYAPQ